MAERKEEPIAWFTASGHHVPIYAGQTRDEAWKEQQIKWNNTEQEKLNREKGMKPRRIFLDDIPAENANKFSDVLDLASRARYTFKAGTKIKYVEVFAGAGTSKEFRDAAKYARRYGGKPEDWQHVAGEAIITDGKVTLHREVHWVQHKNGGVKEAFIKVRH